MCRLLDGLLILLVLDTVFCCPAGLLYIDSLITLHRHCRDSKRFGISKALLRAAKSPRDRDVRCPQLRVIMEAHFVDEVDDNNVCQVLCKADSA